jgi:hypothetical protein
MSSYSAYGTTLRFFSQNGGYRIEKGSSTIGSCLPQNGGWRIEYGSYTEGFLRNGRIEVGTNSSNSVSVSSAEPSGAPDYVKATFYIYRKRGKI